MTLWLRATVSFRTFARLDPSSGVWETVSIETVPAERQRVPDGYFEIVGDAFVALYVDAGQVTIRLASQVIVADEATTVRVTGPLDGRRLVVERCGAAMARLDYAVPLDRIIADDPTPFVEREQFDIGLFVANVCQDPERLRLFADLRSAPPEPGRHGSSL